MGQVESSILPSVVFDAIRREARFTQTEQNGIILYDEADKNYFVEQFEKFRRPMNDILKLLQEELANDATLQKAWVESGKVYEQYKVTMHSILKQKNKMGFPKECHIALICYTLDSPFNIYARLNADCRSINVKSKKTFADVQDKALFLLIRYVMENREVSISSNLPSKLYRGCEKLKRGLTIKQRICFNQLTSTSANHKVADLFKGKGGTLFVLNTNNQQRKDHKFQSLESHSIFPSEQEYLISPFQVYTVKSIKNEGNNFTVIELELF